jgi:hypothetical protein
LGSGESSFQLARDFPNSILLSLESDKHLALENRRELKKIRTDYSDVIFSGLKFYAFKGCLFYTYDFSDLKLSLRNSAIDCLIIDGPVESLYPMGREAALYCLFDFLSVGAVIGIDDYHRKTAQTAVRSWLSTFHGSLEVEKETESFAVLRKVSEPQCWRFSRGITVRSNLIAYKIKTRQFVDQVRRF